MKSSRRSFLAGGLAALSAKPSAAQFVNSLGVPGFGGAGASGSSYPIGTGWNTLPLGAGGLATGMSIANDGKMICRTDVGGTYSWSGTSSDYADPNKRWVPLLTYTTLAGKGPLGGAPVLAPQTAPGAWDHVLAPGNSAVHAAIFNDMTGVYQCWLWYSTNSGATWNKSNLLFASGSADPNGTAYKAGNYKIAVDPANPNVAYCGMPLSSGNSAGVYTSLNQAGGSTLATWASVKTSGSTPIPGVVGFTNPNNFQTEAVSCGLSIDSSLGTTTVGGQTVSRRIILPVGGVGIYESTNGGVSFTEIAAAAFGTTNFYVAYGGCNADGVYYCTVVSSTAYGLWRYASGTWTNITPVSINSVGNFNINTTLIIDPRNNSTSKGYLSIFGPSGISNGFTSANANTGSPPTWNGRTGGANVDFVAPSFDIPYLEDIFGQGSTFCYGTIACIDPNGTCFWTGNQSVWYFGTSASNSAPLASPPNYGGTVNMFPYSIGRGQESTIAEDMLCSPGSTYPILGPQDIGAPVRGTFTTKPQHVAIPGLRYEAAALEYAASDPSFIVCRQTWENDGPISGRDKSCYSANRGADGTWVVLSGDPISLWCPTITADISNGSGGSGFILNVTATSSVINPIALVTQNADGSGTYYGQIQPYGSGGTSGTGGIGTYLLDTASLTSSRTMTAYTNFQGGQSVAVDPDHWVTVGAGYQNYFIPAYTTNARGLATWALCSGLPSIRWMLRSWSNGATSKPFAVGYGTDLGVVWALAIIEGSTTATLYRSTNSGASFSSIGTVTISASTTGVFCLSVPGFPNELWITALYTGGANSRLWHVTNANSASPTFTSITLPGGITHPTALTLGAPSAPGGYPTVYLLAGTGFASEQFLYRGTVVGAPNSPAATVNWDLFGPTGRLTDMPDSFQICAIVAIRGDWNVYQRLYACAAGTGFAYYNPS